MKDTREIRALRRPWVTDVPNDARGQGLPAIRTRIAQLWLAAADSHSIRDRTVMPVHVPTAASLFRHISAERSELYRAIMDVFSQAKRQFRLHLRPDEVREEARWPEGDAPSIEVVQGALSQLTEWGNLTAQPDTGRVSSIEDFYRARFLYRLSEPGEAVEAGVAAFTRALGRRAELQSVALEDITARLETLIALAGAPELDHVKVHEALRDLIAVFGSLADNAQAFMAAVARTIELQTADASALMAYKKRLIDYLERFIGDLVVRSSRIAQHLLDLAPHADDLLSVAAAREARDAAPGADETHVLEEKLTVWRERWAGLNLWFRRAGPGPSQAELLRARARSAIPQLLAALSELNDRRSGKSDRSADFRVLARWFVECESNEAAHRLFRASFALSPARHLALRVPTDRIGASTPWTQAPPVLIHPKLRERGTLSPRGAPPRIRDRSRERALLGQQVAAEQLALDAARQRFAVGQPILLSTLGRLDRNEFRVLLALISEALAAQRSPDECIQRQSADGLLQICLEPLAADSYAEIETDDGVFRGRDHRLTVVYAGAP
ncbi:MAG TPA: TIGR02677 family protein [Polyangiales bacterium]|nr:TIGR02677 family protein [Polyangiales bacterium]